MKNLTDEDFRVMRWIDGELSDDDVADLLEDRPELVEEKESMHQLGAMMEDSLPKEVEVPYGDFFNHRIMNRIEEEGKAAGQKLDSITLDTVIPTLSHFFSSFFSSQTKILSGAAAMGVAMFCIGLVTVASMNGERTQVTSTYVPHESFTADTHFDRNANAAVFEIQGMEALSAHHEVSGYFPGQSEVDPLSGTTTVFSPDGKPLLMLTTDANGTPTIHELTITAGL
tara:strand:+ start:3614 stop:4294 length:681 start_codon:yes stop_codon:yes gene_type:complete